MTSARSLPERLELILGPIQGGWSSAPEGQPRSEVQVAWFGGTPQSPPVMSTLGLSDWTLIPLQSGRRIRCELICPAGSDDSLLAAILFNVSTQLVQNERAVLRGNYVEISDRHVGDWFGVYMTIPVFLDDAYHALETEGGPVALIWALPIRQTEARFIDEAGWEIWEDLLEANFGELGDFHRASLIA